MPWYARVTYRRPSNGWEERACAENWREYFGSKDTAVPTHVTPDF